MNVLIVEDEMMARSALAKTLLDNFSGVAIVGMTSSVRESIDWLSNPDNRADVIFMDVELSDGNCFEIFRQVDVKAKVIMATAYDSYAVPAFEAGSIDYLLKPIELSALKRAVSRCGDRQDDESGKILEAMDNAPRKYRERFLVTYNSKIVPLRSSEIVYFFSEAKDNHIVTRSGGIYVMDCSLDAISGDLNPAQFFRINRSCIIHKDIVDSIVKIMGGRLQVCINVPDGSKNGHHPDFTVSRSRADDFLEWMKN